MEIFIYFGIYRESYRYLWRGYLLRYLWKKLQIAMKKLLWYLWKVRQPVFMVRGYLRYLWKKLQIFAGKLPGYRLCMKKVTGIYEKSYGKLAGC